LATAGRIALGVVAAAVLAELLVRLATPAPPPEPADALPRVADRRALERPGADAVFHGARVRTNRHGFRGPDWSRRPPPDTWRIGVVGDSVAFGRGVPEADAYPARLEALLRDRGHGAQVLNLGMGGLAAAEVVSRARRALAAYRMHTLVYGFSLGDIEGRWPASVRPEVRERLAAERRRWAGHPLRLVGTLLRFQGDGREARTPTPGSYTAVLRQRYLAPGSLHALERELRRFASIHPRRVRCLVLFVQPKTEGTFLVDPYAGLYRVVVDLGRRLGLHVIDGSGAFGSTPRWRLRQGAADGHPNALGHALLARALADGLPAEADCRPGAAGAPGAQAAVE